MGPDDRAQTTALDGRQVVPTEWVVARVRSNARRLVAPAVLFIALAGVLPYGFSLTTAPWQGVVIAVAGGAVLVLGVLLPYLLWLNRRYTVTSRRVIVRTGFFVRTRREVFHSRGYTVTLKRSWVQAIARSGTIVLSTGIDAPLILDDVAGAGAVANALNELLERSQSAGPRTASTFQHG